MQSLFLELHHHASRNDCRSIIAAVYIVAGNIILSHPPAAIAHHCYARIKAGAAPAKH